MVLRLGGEYTYLLEKYLLKLSVDEINVKVSGICFK